MVSASFRFSPNSPFWLPTPLSYCFDILVALLTVPYYNQYLPGQCNFITCPGNSALNMSLTFFDDFANPTLPDGIVNCLRWVLDNGFNVPYAGCHGIPCQPDGFITPSMTKRYQNRRNTAHRHRNRYSNPRGLARYRSDDPWMSPYNMTSRSGRYRHILNPLWTAEQHRAPVMADGRLMERLNEHIRSTRMSCSARRAMHLERALNLPNISLVTPNCTNKTAPVPNPPPCFSLSCLPTKVMALWAHTIAFGGRAINAAFQTRFTDSQGYFNGVACNVGQPCLASDLTQMVLDLIAPLECVCEFVLLVIPPEGYPDPCCAVTSAAEIIAAFFQIIINIANSVTQGQPYTYIVSPNGLTADFNVLLNLALEGFDCVCSFMQIIFNVAFSGTNLAKAFDPVCLPRVYFNVGLETIRLLFQTALALSTLELQTSNSQCYLYVNDPLNARPNCSYSISEVGIVGPISQNYRHCSGTARVQPSLGLCPATESGCHAPGRNPIRRRTGMLLPVRQCTLGHGQYDHHGSRG